MSLNTDKLNRVPMTPLDSTISWAKPCEIYIFHRSAGWYPLQLDSDDDAVVNAECNLGTLKVMTKSGRHVWPQN